MLESNHPGVKPASMPALSSVCLTSAFSVIQHQPMCTAAAQVDNRHREQDHMQDRTQTGLTSDICRLPVNLQSPESQS